jgi:hypothetical protein
LSTTLLFELLQPFNIGQILEPAGGLHVRNQVVARQDRHREAGELRTEPVGPRVIEFDAVDRRDDADSNRRRSDLKDEAGPAEITLGQILKRSAKRGECF